MNVEIKLLEGIVVNGKAINIGMPKDDIINLLGAPEVIRNSFYYFNSELRFDFSQTGQLSFIEFLGGIKGALQPNISGHPVFLSDAELIFSLLSKHNSGRILDNENGHSLCFCNIGIGLFRESTPADYSEMLDEIKQLGVEIDTNSNLREEYEKAYHWATIGIGSKDYYKPRD